MLFDNHIPVWVSTAPTIPSRGNLMTSEGSHRGEIPIFFQRPRLLGRQVQSSVLPYLLLSLVLTAPNQLYEYEI